MRRYIFIGIGGFLGANIRFAIKSWQVISDGNLFYTSTIIINSLGCFVLALFLRLAFDIWELNQDLRLGITTGFIGAFTTFSTLCRETTVLFSAGKSFLSLVNLILSVTAGLAAIYSGGAAAKKIIKLKGVSDEAKNISDCINRTK